MEKSKAPKKRQFNYRLLIFLFLIAEFFLQPCAFSEITDDEKLINMQIQCQEEIIFTQKECFFTLLIPGIRAENIRTTLPTFPQGVQLISSRRTEFIDKDRDVGTQIEFWFYFSAPGSYEIPALQAFINEKNYKIKFKKFNVYENPNTIIPKMIIKFTSGINKSSSQNIKQTSFSENLQENNYECTVGKKVCFTVYVQHSSQIVKLDWQLQKNALLEAVEQFETTKSNSFSDMQIPVASFEWTPLSEGLWNLPEIKITALAFNGNKEEITTPLYNIYATEKTTPPVPYKNETLEDNSIFSYAFTQEQTIQNNTKDFSIKREDCEQIRLLRQQERKFLPFSNKSNERAAYEKLLGIKEQKSEPSEPLFLLLSITTVMLFLIYLILSFQKKRVSILLILILAFLTLSVFYGKDLKNKYAVFLGGSVCLIPEKNVDTFQNEIGGTRVRILGQTGSWVYINNDDIRGWVSNSSLLPIN